MIFKTIERSNGNIGLGTNLGNIKDFFTRQNILSDSDMDAIRAYNAQIDACVTSQTAFNRTMLDASEKAQTLVERANGNTIALGNLTRASKAAELGMKGIAIASNMLAMWAISKVISGLVEFVQVSDNVAKKAQEIGTAYSKTSAEIDDYKKRIDELHNTINDNSSSIEQVTDARQNLMIIQDELIDKFGDEKEAIELITSAINDQSNALDGLRTDAYQDLVNDFNNGGIINKVRNKLDGYSSNIDRMKAEMESPSNIGFTGKNSYDFTFSKDKGKYKEFATTINKIEGVSSDIFKLGLFGTGKALSISVDGNLEESYKKLKQIQEIANNFGLEDTDFGSKLTDQINDAKKKLDSYSDMWDSFILEEKILSESGINNGYDKIFKNLNDAMDEYNEAKLTGDEEKIRKAGENYASILSEGISNIDDDAVIDYLKSMYPEMQEIVGKWDLEYNLKAKTDTSDEKGIKDALSKFSGTEELKKYEVNSSKDSEKNDAYIELENYADKYNLTTDQLIEKLQQLGYVQNEKYNELVNKFGQENVDKIDEEDLQFAYSIENVGNMTFEQLQGAIEEAKKASEEAATPKSFKEAWNDFGTTGDEETQKAQQEAKEKLLELAKAGELTPEVLENNKIYATLLESVGNNAEKAAKKINEMVEISDQLSSMKSGISAISDVLAEKKENQKNKKTKEAGIGADKLAGFDDSFKDLDAWEDFEKTLGDGQSSMEDCRKAANQLATEWVNSNNFLSQLTKGKEKYYISTLKEMGVENAEAVVTAALTNKKKDLELAEKYLNAAKESNVVTTTDLSNATVGEINQLANEQTWSDETKQALYRLALQKQIANGIHLNTSQDINNLKAFVKGLGGTGTALETYQKMLEHGGSYSTEAMANAWRNANKELEDAANGVEVKVDDSPPATIPDKNNTNNNTPTKTKETKQSFDWLERRISVLNNRLDLLKAKIENVFTVKKKNSIIDDEIKKTNKLINTYKKQAKVYKQQANASATYKKGKKKTKLSKDLRKKIQNGEIKGSRKKLIETYGENPANAIQKYRDNWDKYQEALTNVQSARTSRRELKIQKRQNWVDYYDSISDAYDAHIENLSSAKAKNDLEKDRLEYVKKSYDKQIAIAKLEENSVKAATLLAKKWKEIAETRERILQNQLDENADKRDYNNAAYENADKAGKQKLIQDNIASYKSDDSAHDNNVNSAKAEAKDAKSEVTKAGKAVTGRMKKDGLNKSTTKEIQSYINKGQKIPDGILEGTRVMLPELYEKLVAYNDSIDAAKTANEAVIAAQKQTNLSAEEDKANIRKENSNSIQLDIDAADNKYDRLAAEYDNLTTVSAKNSNIDKQLEAQKTAYEKKLDQLDNDITDKEELADAKAKAEAEWKTTQREQHITQFQNLSDEQSALYDLNQQQEANADSAKEKNKYETMSRDNLKAQYGYQIQIARENKDSTEEKRLQLELAEKTEESYKRQIENIREEYDLMIGMNNARKSTIDAQISALQANGYGVGTELYEIQIALDKESYTNSLKEIERISAELPNLTGNALKEAEKELESEKQAAWGFQQAMAEAQKAINEINLGKFERLKRMLEYISNDLEYMQTILSHSDFTFSDKEIGGLTMEGLSDIALDFGQIANNVEQISNLWSQIAELKRQFNNGEYADEDQYDQDVNALIQQIHDLESANYDLGDSIKDAVIDSLNSLADALDESISKYKDALQAQKDLYDYRRKVSDQLKSIASLEKQLAALQGSDSEEARARIQKLQLELEDEQQNLKDMEYDKYIQDQEEMLDKVSEDFQDFIANVAEMSVLDICKGMKDAVSDNLDKITSSIQQKFEDSTAIGSLAGSMPELIEALKNIDYAGKVNTGVDENGNSYYQYTDDNGNVMVITKDKLGNIISVTENGKKVEIPEKPVANTEADINNAVSASASSQKRTPKTPDSSILSQNATSNYGAPKIAGEEYYKKQKDMWWAVLYFLNNASSSFDGCGPRMSWDPLNQYLYTEYEKMLDPDQENALLEHLGIKGDSSYKNRNALFQAAEKLKELGFSQGGVASELNKVALANGDDGWATLKRGESILTPEQTEQFRKLVLNLNPLNSVADAVKATNNVTLPNKTDYNNTTTIGNVDVHLDGSNVVDADSFIKTLHNPRVLKEVSSGVSSQIGTTMSNRLGGF